MTYNDQVVDALRAFQFYLNKYETSSADHPAGRVSSFWTSHFAARRNFPNVKEFLSFRRENFVYGIGETSPASDQKKFEEFNEICKSIRLFTPLEFIESLREPIIGAPILFPIGGSYLSASFVLNAGTTWRVMELLKQFGPSRPLHIAEIGAGWGACATQFHQISDIASYTLIDLPENLCLSSTYLSLALPDRHVNFVDCRKNSLMQRSLNFALPSVIDILDGPYDIIINTMSFQEMDLETVRTYFRWASRSLAKGGLLISFNSHDKAGVQRPRQYLHDGLSLVHMAPFRKVPAGWFNTIPYEMVFKRTDEMVVNRLSLNVDVIGELIQLGLDGDLNLAIGDVILTAGNTSLLNGVHAMLFPSSEAERQQTFVRETQRGNLIIDFLAANYWYSIGNMPEARRLLLICLGTGLDGFARTRAQAMLAAIGVPVDRAAMLESAAGLGSELDALVKNRRVSAFQDHIARVMDCQAARGTFLRRFGRATKKVLHRVAAKNYRSAS